MMMLDNIMIKYIVLIKLFIMNIEYQSIRKIINNNTQAYIIYNFLPLYSMTLKCTYI